MPGQFTIDCTKCDNCTRSESQPTHQSIFIFRKVISVNHSTMIMRENTDTSDLSYKDQKKLLLSQVSFMYNAK